MNIWRLIPHHERPAEFAEWSRNNKVIAVGWGQMGDLRRQSFRDEGELKLLTARTHPGYTTNSWVNGGRSLWRLYNDVQIGDLVIISASGSRKLTMRVTGDYYFTNDDASHYYEHRRKAAVVPINPNHLWRAANRVAPGEGIYGTLVRCARTLTEAEVNAITD